MEESPLMPQGRNTHQENQVPLGNSNRERYRPRPQTGAKSYILELCTYLYGKFVEGSPSVLSLGRLCDELGSSCWWQPGENPERTEGKRTIPCCHDNFVPCRGHKARGYSIIPTWHDAAWGNRVPGKEVAETLFRLLEPFSKRVVDDDAALTRKFPSADHEAGRNPHAKTSPPSVVTDAGRRGGGGRPSRERQKRQALSEGKRATDSKPKGDHHVSSQFPQDPECEV